MDERNLTDLRGTGWRPSPPPSLAQRAASKMRASVALIGALSRPSEGGLDAEPWILDQGKSEACGGHWAAQAIYLLTGRKVSPWFPWWFARAYDQLPNRPNLLPNEGATFVSILQALREHGACPYSEWSEGTPQFSWTRIPAGLARATAQKFNLRTDPIWETGNTALESVLQALLAKKPVGVVVNVDAGFQTPIDGVVGPESGNSRGRHFIVANRFRTVHTAAGPRVLVNVINSWGAGWGVNGCAWLDEQRIKDAVHLCVARSVS